MAAPGMSSPGTIALSFFGGALSAAALGGVGLLLHLRGHLQHLLGGAGAKAATVFRVSAEASDDTRALLFRR